MGSKSLTPEQMEARTARFKDLKTYQTQNFEAHNIPPGAVEKVTARKVFPVMAPADDQGPGLHRHLNTVENFFCLSGRFEISWGDEGEHKLVLEPNDMISIPRGENRKFFNVSNEVGRLLVMIVPETDQQIDPISYAPSLGREIESEYGKQALEGLQTIGLKFEKPVG